MSVDDFQDEFDFHSTLLEASLKAFGCFCAVRVRLTTVQNFEACSFQRLFTCSTVIGRVCLQAFR